MYLQPFTEKGLFISFLLKSQADSLKKDSTSDVFWWNCLIFQNSFLRSTFGWWLLLLNTIHFFLLRWPHQQNVTLDLSYILIIFKYFQSKHCESLVNSCFWKTKTISWFFTDKTSSTFKMFLEIKSSRPAVFSKFSLERICDEVIFS